jgi:precorrin-2 dehydrogenase/sirohydrochlorin ferrochelatase
LSHKYPVFLDLYRKSCLVIGGGRVALRKIKLLSECGAKITVLSPEACPEILQMAEDKKLSLFSRRYIYGDVSGHFLVIAATDDKDTNQLAYDESIREKVWINVVDVPKLCTFILPAIMQSGDLTIAVSTNGKSPALAGKIKKELYELFDKKYDDFLDVMFEIRENLKVTIPNDQDKRASILKSIVNTYEPGMDLEEEVQKWL